MRSYNYVVVFTENGAKFVTKKDAHEKICYWDTSEKPLLFSSKEMAQNVALGLTLNSIFAVAVSSNYELTEQPYNYKKGHFEWKSDKQQNN